MILNDITSNNILEEVVYTVGLSMSDNLDVEEVVFMVENEEIYSHIFNTDNDSGLFITDFCFRC